MNNVVLIGRLTADPKVNYNQKEDGSQSVISRYTLAVNRRGKDAGADFISVVAFGKAGEFVEKYLKKGTQIAVQGRIQTGSYTNKDGQKVYTTEVVAENHEFVGSKPAAEKTETPAAPANEEGFMEIPEGIDEELPFN